MKRCQIKYFADQILFQVRVFLRSIALPIMCLKALLPVWSSNQSILCWVWLLVKTSSFIFVKLVCTLRHCCHDCTATASITSIKDVLCNRYDVRIKGLNMRLPQVAYFTLFSVSMTSPSAELLQGRSANYPHSLPLLRLTLPLDMYFCLSAFDLSGSNSSDGNII